MTWSAGGAVIVTGSSHFDAVRSIVRAVPSALGTTAVTPARWFGRSFSTRSGELDGGSLEVDRKTAIDRRCAPGRRRTQVGADRVALLRAARDVVALRQVDAGLEQEVAEVVDDGSPMVDGSNECRSPAADSW